jgi:hypothetical protein
VDLKNKNSILILCIGLAIGLFFRKPTIPVPVISCDEKQCEEKLTALKSKFEKISEEDIDEYIRLKDMKTKYEKADEIFGKILNIFLLDLGLRMTAKQIDDLKSAPTPLPYTRQDPEPQLSKAETRQRVPPISNPLKRKRPVNTRGDSSDEGVRKLLDENALDNPISAWGGAKPLDRGGFELVRGRFVGQIIFFDKERVPWDVDMELTNAHFRNGKIIGEFQLKTVDPANPKHRDITTGEAGSTISNFRSTEDGSILVEAMGGDGVFQLYYFPVLRSFQGNVYEKHGLEEFKRTGTMILNRR